MNAQRAPVRPTVSWRRWRAARSRAVHSELKKMTLRAALCALSRAVRPGGCGGVPLSPLYRTIQVQPGFFVIVTGSAFFVVFASLLRLTKAPPKLISGLTELAPGPGRCPFSTWLSANVRMTEVLHSSGRPTSTCHDFQIEFCYLELKLFMAFN